MTDTINQQQMEEDPQEKMNELTALLAKYFNGIQQMQEENKQLRQRVATLESENAALTETLEQWKNGDEWSSRVTYDNVVDQIASLEDASKRDDARRMFEALLKKSQVTQFRKRTRDSARGVRHGVRNDIRFGDAVMLRPRFKF